jgi:hypothetical protein
VFRLEDRRFYESLGYATIKIQYSFIKPLNPAAAARVQTFVPRVDPASESDEAGKQHYDH